MTSTNLDNLCINTIRTLSIDAVQKAKSGHPGTPMSMAPVAYCLWQRFLRFYPDHPEWINRDRFVLSMGHASALLYSLLHLCGVKAIDKEGNLSDRLSVNLDDIKNFRQLDGICPGHPEYGLTSGVETTTGPLGQGAANSVGMAIASRWKAGFFNRPAFDLFNYDVYALCSDGDMMEGVSGEAASIAGHLKLSNLCWIYDSNRITIEGSTDLAFSEDVGTRFSGYGWNILYIEDANDLDSLTEAFNSFKNTNDRPSLIIVKSHIGFGSPNKQDKASAHGEPLGEDEIALAKKNYGWPPESNFFVPPEVPAHFEAALGKRGQDLYNSWSILYNKYKSSYPELDKYLSLMQDSNLPARWDEGLTPFPADEKGMATRVSSGKVLNAVAERVPWMMGGSADLAPSTKTLLTSVDERAFTVDNPAGRNFHFGIREHAMGSILNGMCLSGLRSYGSTFLIFSDYARPALRLSALMEIPVIYIFTHDSIGVGEDGPTHQPVEHIASLRAMPGLITLRPADANEVVESWRIIMELRHEPVALFLTRQNLPTLDRNKYAPASGLSRGAYILAEAKDGNPDVLLLATGSEVHLCIEAYEQLNTEGIKARVVSMPSWELFEKQDKEYRDSVLPPKVVSRIAVEQASIFGWERYSGTQGLVIGMHSFGASAPLKDVQRKFGFTPENIVQTVKDYLNNSD